MTVASFNQVLTARVHADLFDPDPNIAAKQYQRLLRQCHPDMVGGEDKVQAQAAFIHLNELWAATSKTTPDNDSRVVIRTRRHEYEVVTPLPGDDTFDIFEATYDAGHGHAMLLIAHDVADADLVEAYANALKADKPLAYTAFFPDLIEAFRYNDNGTNYPALAINLHGRVFSLMQIHEAYPQGIHGRDLAWMWRRMLVALGNTHDINLLHGAPLMDAWYIQPEQHGVVLAGWQYSVKQGEKLRAVPETYRGLYPAGVFDGQPQGPALDIHLAAKTMLKMADPNPHVTPPQLLAYLRGCTLSALPSASDLLGEFDELLERVYGGKQFHVFRMPPVAS